MQVRKYLNKELDAKAMHRLESEALNDPFLMDALDGFEAAPPDQQANLADLTARLQKRVEPQKGRVIAWRTWAIAASVILALTIGGLWIKKTREPWKEIAAVVKPDNTQVELKDTAISNLQALKKTTVVARNNPPVVLKSVPPAQQPIAHRSGDKNEKSLYQQEISAGDNKVAQAPVLKEVKVASPTEADKAISQQDSPSMGEMVVMNYTDNKADSLAALAKKAREKMALSTGDTKLIGKVSGLDVVTSKDAKVQFGYTTVGGIIIGKNDGQPVIGAAVRIFGTNKSTVTDVNGVFAMPVTKGKQTLDIASIGYQPKRVSVNMGDSLKVELTPNDASLNEVVVTGYGTAKKASVADAHPQGDMDAFKKYLESSAALSPVDIAGTVSVIFTVNADGSLSDFKIKKSLSPIADQKAIDLIKAGPTWVANSAGKAEQVTIKVKFRK